MDQWKKKSLIREEQFRQGTVTSPSFSSTLLDSIYRSIDQGIEEEQRGFHRETMKKKQQSTNNVRGGGGGGIERKEMDKWVMLEKNKEIRRKSLPDFDRKVLLNNDHRSSMFIHSTSSSSDSSSGGGFSSSEAESVYGTRPRSSSVPAQRPPKPIRTSQRNETQHNHHQQQHDYQRTRSNSVSHHEQQQQQKSKKQHENGFIRTKSKALKIYGDLKKVKQPISPGGRLATFINSLFHAKKQRKTTEKEKEEDFRISETKSKSTQTSSTCSSASANSSFSRSCLSKAPSSSSIHNGGTVKRSVRFYPVSVIVDEDSRPCGEKSVVYGEDKTKPKANLIMSSNTTVVVDAAKEQRRIQEAARDLIVSYRKNNDFIMRSDSHSIHSSHEVDDDDDDDDAASYASSDLFELDNLASIGIDHRYSQELPVYETTHFQMNRAIANGFIL